MFSLSKEVRTLHSHKTFTPEQLRFLKLLSVQYPTVQAAGAEIIKLKTILNLPKGTEHFMSDIHGEYEAFLHILNSGSGEVRNKLDETFEDRLSREEKDQLATLIHYPKAKLAIVANELENLSLWYNRTIHLLVQVCRYVGIKHTRNLMRSHMPVGYREIIDELIHLRNEDGSKQYQYENIISSIIEIGQAGDVIQALCEVIKALTCDHLHIVGDIFDRGPGRTSSWTV